MEEIERKIKKIIIDNMEAEVEECPDFTFDDKISSIAMNSIIFITIIVELEEAFGITVDDEWLIYDEESTFRIFINMVNNLGEKI